MADHPFGGYNKPDGGAPTLVGNWTEERALKDKTGDHRLKSWVEKPVKPDETTSIYGTRAINPSGYMPTFKRTIEHDNNVRPSEYMSTNKAVYQCPSERKGELSAYRPVETLGMREQAELKAMMEAADAATPYPEAIPMSYATTTGDTFTPKEMNGNTVGARVMMTQDGGPVYRDPTFLKETKFMAPETINATMPDLDASMGATKTAKLGGPSQPGSSLHEPPITIYSEAAASGKYGSDLHGTTNPNANRGNPFGTSRNFTKPLSAYDKVVIDE